MPLNELIDGLILLMDSPEELTGPINLGRPVEFTMLELAQHVLEETGSRSKIVFRPLPEDDPVQRCPDITRARVLLGWEPKIGRDEGRVPIVIFLTDGMGKMTFPDGTTDDFDFKAGMTGPNPAITSILVKKK